MAEGLGWTSASSDVQACELLAWARGQGWPLVELLWALGIVFLRLGAEQDGVGDFGAELRAWEARQVAMSSDVVEASKAYAGGPWGWLGVVGMLVGGMAWALDRGDLEGR